MRPDEETALRKREKKDGCFSQPASVILFHVNLSSADCAIANASFASDYYRARADVYGAASAAALHAPAEAPGGRRAGGACRATCQQRASAEGGDSGGGCAHYAYHADRRCHFAVEGRHQIRLVQSGTGTHYAPAFCNRQRRTRLRKVAAACPLGILGVVNKVQNKLQNCFPIYRIWYVDKKEFN